ncbi:MAG: histidine kinase [Acidithiobacillales bacterium SM23_46]|jgi:CBS domain-containing protein|nr:MAG: histidine kinase [Acidithiobacillales bacterium SM23_46]KPL26526.1 MAG: histidine kinase [Acidithiobacillales bacterium SM1_46]
MTVGTVCNRDVVYTTPDTSAPEAARLMREFHVGNLVVSEERAGKRFPVGIVTDRDLVVEVLAQGVAPESVTVADMMSATLVTARESDDLMDTIKRMRVKGVRRIPVLGADGALVGILSVDDAIDLLAEELTDLARLITREQQREHMRRPGSG